MKRLTYIKYFCSVIVLGLLPFYLFSQFEHASALQNKVGVRIKVDTTVSDNTHLELFDSQMIISGLAFSGDIVFHSDSSLLRIILMDKNYNEYLIYEAYPILSGSRQFSVNEVGEETILLDQVTPYRVIIELVDASIYLKEFLISHEDNYLAKTKGALVVQQNRNKIDRINENIRDQGQTWIAGETAISKLSYQQKKSMFGAVVPNFQGFEYYVGGVFVLPGALGEASALKSAPSENSSEEEDPYPDEFNWRDRHGRDWTTPVKHQGSCWSCFAFGSTAAAEQMVNLYFNQHLDYDLSEQNVLSCSGGSCDEGGVAAESFDLLIRSGIVLEDCFPYTASDQDCSEICENPSERIRAESWIKYHKEQDFKREIIAGAAAGNVFSWRHAVQMTGYKVLEAGDKLYERGYDSTSYITIEHNSPLIGQTAWLCKNSWGETWGENGFGYFISDIGSVSLYVLKGTVESMILNDSDIRCVDQDGDGYFCWGIGPKPAHCPESPDEADGDDSDRCMGPSDEFGNLTFITPSPEATDSVILLGSPPDLFISGSNIRWYNDMELQNLVHEGGLFSTGHLKPGKYTYYATQTKGACESAADDVSLLIFSEIPPPAGHDTVLNIRESAVLTVEGEQGATFTWYEDPLLSIVLGQGASFEAVRADTGTYTYYVTQTLGAFESTADMVELRLHNIISVPDPAFLNALIERGVDNNSDGLISNEEAEAVISLVVSGKEIRDMTGIEAFVNLNLLDCSDNTELESLDVSNNPALKKLNCSNDYLGSLDVSNNPELTHLDCSSNRLYNLHVSSTPALQQLNCSYNLLATVETFNNPVLTQLDCSDNTWLWHLDLSNNPVLTILDCSDNRLSRLDVSNNVVLYHLDCSYNSLYSLDFANSSALSYLNCRSNRLTKLDISNQTVLSHLNCRSNELRTLDLSCNTGFGNWSPDYGWDCALDFRYMTSLRDVCIWQTYHSESIPTFTMGSENFQFTYSCGICSSGTKVDSDLVLSVFPIPSHDFLSIETGISDQYIIEIASLNGQLIFSRTMEGPTHRLDLSSFKIGVYLITIRSKYLVRTRKIFII